MIAMFTLVGLGLSACSKSEHAGIEEARKQAAAENKAKLNDPNLVAKKIDPPVPGEQKLTCAQLIDADKFTQLLGETAPVVIHQTKDDAEAAASCSVIRGGKAPSAAEQTALKKKNGRLGVMPGDEICNIAAYCWTIEAADRFAKKCIDSKATMDSALGFPACLRVQAEGEADKHNYRFFDEDTKCLIGVRGGPSMVDNDIIAKCATGAHDLIGPDQIKPGAAPAAPGGSGSGSGA
ncbi:hypothetical protein BH11MYX1_BH11MYX1_40050 [soil metagenome]